MTDAKIIRFGIPINYDAMHSDELQARYELDLSVLKGYIEEGISNGLGGAVLLEADDVVAVLDVLKEEWMKEVDNG